MTLEDFLERECGMAPRQLVDYYEPHREFIEGALTDYQESTNSTSDTWSEYTALIWLYIPKLPDWWQIS